MALGPQESNKQIVTLCMIVKDEAQVITRALDSVRSFVDHIFICDTGSADLTKDIIELYLTENKLSGKVVSTQWKDFGHNRTECFDLAKDYFPDSDYLMTLDADEIIVPWNKVPLDNKHVDALPVLEGDTLYVKTCYGPMEYSRATLFKASLPWKWVGVIHEYATCEEATHANTIANICNLPSTDGARSKNPDKYIDDAKLIEKDLERDPENSRSWFYLAQSYGDAHKPELAVSAIENAIKYTTWGEEKFDALLKKAHYKRQAGVPFSEVVGDYLCAYQQCPHRVEPLYYIISHYRAIGDYETASLFLQKALSIPYPTHDLLFVESSIYHWRLQDEASLVYYYTGEPKVAYAIALLLLEKDVIPADDKERIKANVVFFDKPLKEG